MIEPRVYRAAFLPALLAAVLAMFSLESRPRPLTQGLAADVLFDARLAAQTAARLAEAEPSRQPGQRGNRATADLVAEGFADRGFTVSRDRFEQAGRELENVIGRRAGRSRRQLVLVANRDALVAPDATGSASDTAALLELARVFEGRPTRKTLVLASLDGSTLGELGARRLAGELDSSGLVDAVLVMSDLGSPEARGPSLQAWSNDSRRAGISLERTVEESIRQEVGRLPGRAGALGQLARLSFPIGVGSQGVLLERGLEAVRISGSGELPPRGSGPREAVDEDRLGTLGRATLRAVTALDQAERRERGPESYVLAVSQVVPGWVLAMLSGSLLIPVLVATVDAFARARRRRVPVLVWLRWVGAWAAPFLVGLLCAEALGLLGATPSPPPAPAAPQDVPLDGAAMGVLAGVVAAMGAGFAAARLLAVRPVEQLRELTDPGAGVALALVVCGAAAALWLVNPYAALLAAPAAHLWMLAVLSRPPPPRRARAVLVGLGVFPGVVVWAYYLVELSLDPLEGAWYLLMLVIGHAVGLTTALIACVWLGALGAVIEITRRTPRVRPERSVPSGPEIFGPGRYAGPGSLGGTESALRR